MTIKKSHSKDPNKNWDVVVYLGKHPLKKGEVRAKASGLRTHDEAVRTEKRFKAMTPEEYLNLTEDHTFQELYDSWLKTYNDVSASTKNHVIGIFDNHILPKFKDRYIKTITPLDCEAVLSEWKANKQNAQKTFTYFKKVLTFAETIGWIEKNPAKDIKNKKPDSGKAIGEPSRDYYDSDQLAQFLNMVKDNFSVKQYALMEVFAMTGARNQEARALFWRDVDLREDQDENLMDINKAVTEDENKREVIGSTKTYASRRKLSMMDSTVEALRELKVHEEKLYGKALKADWLIFGAFPQDPDKPSYGQQLMSKDTPVKWMTEMRMLMEDEFANDKPEEEKEFETGVYDRRSGRRIGTKKMYFPQVTPHGMRHTHASLLAELEFSPRAAQERLGHKTSKMTMEIYQHVSAKMRRKESEKLNAFNAKRNKK